MKAHLSSSSPAFRYFRTSRQWSVAAVIAAAYLTASGGAQAATDTWKGGTATWATGFAPAAPTSADTADFNGTGGGTPAIVNLTTNQAANGITVEGTQTDPVLLEAGSVTTNPVLSLGSGGISIANGANTVTIGSATAKQNVSVALTASQAWTNNSASLLSEVNGVTNGTTSPVTLTVNGSGTGGTTFTGAISDGTSPGTTALTVATTGGVTTLSSANTFTGGLLVQSGTVVLGNATSLGAGTVTLGSSAGGSASILANSITTTKAITLGTSAVGTLTVGNNGGTTAAVFSGGVATNGDTLTLTESGTTGSVTESGGITGTGNLVLNDTSTTSGGVIVSTTAVGITGTVLNNGGGSGASTVSAAITSASSVTQNSTTSALILSGANTYTGNTVITAGTLQLGAGGTTGTLSTSSAITDNGNFTINRSNAVTQGTDFTGSAITGTGSFTLNATSATLTTTLTAANSFAGGVTITKGTLQLGNGGTSGTLGTTGAFVNNGTFSINRSNTITQGTDFSASGITGTGGLTLAGGGTLVLTANNTFTGYTSVNAGGIQLSGAGATLGAGGLGLAAGTTVDLNGQNSSVAGLNAASTASDAILENSANGTTSTLTLTGSGGYYGMLNDSTGDGVGSGVLAVVYTANSGTNEFYSGSSDYSGGTTITGTGDFRVASVSGLGTGAITLNGGYLHYLGSGTVTNNFVINNVPNSVLRNDANVTYAGSFTGSGTFVNSGNTNSTVGTFTGDLSNFTGTLDVEYNAGSQSTASAYKQNKTEINGTATTGTLTNFVLGSSSTLVNGADILEYDETTSGQTMNIGNLSGNAQGILRANLANATGIFSIGNATSSTYQGQITNGYNANAVTAVVKVGSGTLTLAGGGSYTGGTTVANGVLNVTGGGLGASQTTDSTTSGSTTVSVSSTAGLAVGEVVSGSGLAAGSVPNAITSINTANNTITVLYSATSTVTGTAALNFAASNSTGTGTVTVGGVSGGGATATLEGTGYTGPIVTSSANGNVAHLAPGVNTTAANLGSAGTLHVNGLVTIGAGTALDFDLSSNPSSGNDLIAATGAVSFGSSATFNFNQLGTLSLGTAYTLLTGSTVTDAGTVFTTTGDGSLVATYNNTGTALTVTFTGATLTSEYFTGSTSGDVGNGNNYTATASGTTPTGSAPTAATDVYFTANTGSTGAGALTPNTNTNALTAKGLIFTGTGTPATLSVALSGTNNVTVGGDGITVQTGSGNHTISAPVVLAASQSWNVTDASNVFTVSNQVSDGGNAYALTKSGAGTLVLSNASGNNYSGGTSVTAGRLLVKNSTGSGTGSGAVTVTGSTAVLGGNGKIGGAVTLSSGATLYSGAVATGTPTTGPGTGLTLTSALNVNGAALTFALSNTATSTFANPATSTTYLSLGSTGTISFTGTDAINLVDLTSGGLSLRMNQPYLLVSANSASMFHGLVIENSLGQYGLSDTGFQGYVLGVATGTGTLGSAGSYTTININEFGADGVSTLADSTTASPGYYSPQLVLIGGDLEVVPEPSTWALMIGGLVLLVIWRRRQSSSV